MFWNFFLESSQSYIFGVVKRGYYLSYFEFYSSFIYKYDYFFFVDEIIEGVTWVEQIRQSGKRFVVILGREISV